MSKYTCAPLLHIIDEHSLRYCQNFRVSTPLPKFEGSLVWVHLCRRKMVRYQFDKLSCEFKGLNSYRAGDHRLLRRDSSRHSAVDASNAL